MYVKKKQIDVYINKKEIASGLLRASLEKSSSSHP